MILHGNVAVSPIRFIADNWRFDTHMQTPPYMNMNIGIFGVIAIIITILNSLLYKKKDKDQVDGLGMRIYSNYFYNNISILSIKLISVEAATTRIITYTVFI